jgi:hypothetical protein
MGAAVLPVRFPSSAYRSPEQLEEQEEALMSPSAPPLFDPTTIGLLGGLTAAVLVLNVPSQIDMLMQGGTAVLESLSSIGAGYLSMAETHPLATAIGTASTKGVLSDLIAQLAVERKARPNFRRVLAFAVFGGLYLGVWGHYKYAMIYPAIFGAAKTLPIIVSKVVFDLFLNGPLVYFPLYFVIKGFFAGKGPADALREYITPNGRNLVLRYWATWTPVEVCMWTFVPPNLRVPFLSMVSLIWTVVLSTLSYKKRTN